MRRWTRWQDWAALVVGVYAFLSPIWTTTVGKATTTMIILGVITALAALWSLATPDAMVPDGLVALLGVLFFISPWVIGFHATSGIAWTAWVVGIVTFVAGLWALPESNRLRHGGHIAAQH
ncbi:MAG TPA: SPW repeat protein [Jatrophihabitans sp.]